MAEKRRLLGAHLLDVFGRPAVAGRVGEVRAVVGEHRVDPVRHGRGEMPQEVSSDRRVAFSCSSTKANLEARSIATSRYSLPCSVRTSARSTWE